MPAALPKQATQPPGDFASALGPPVTGGKLMQLLDGAAQRAGATIAAVSLSEYPASQTELGRTEVTVQLSGPYAASRRMLQELHDRLPALQVRRMKLQTTAAPGGQVQASLVLSVWSAPVAATASVAR